MAVPAESKQADSHVRRLNSRRFMSSVPPALFKNGAIFFSEELDFSIERPTLVIETPAVFNGEATASEEGITALRLESAVFKKSENFLNGATGDSDEEVPIFSEAVLAFKDADSSLIEDPIFSCKESIGACLAAGSDLSAWAASV